MFLDESDARMAARILGLKISGVIGILIKAKLAGKYHHFEMSSIGLEKMLAFG